MQSSTQRTSAISSSILSFSPSLKDWSPYLRDINLLNDVTNKFDDVIKATPHIIDFQKMSNEEVLEHYYLSVGAESLWDSRELIMKAISEQNKLIREEYENSNKG